ncbi:MAG: 2-amino-4-hydroxy-6-hydroxymethyldihydropteridine diphosphokinase [Acidiphilium sp.]
MILIALGANLPGPEGGAPNGTCRQALAALRAIPALEFVSVSRWYRTSPVPPAPDQPDYCNGVARFAGVMEPMALLAALHEIEAAFGRRREATNAARTLDLDLIDMDGRIRRDPPPVLPHPRAHLRKFVLRPLLDVAPDWVHPVLEISGRRLLADLNAARDETIEPW